MNIEWRPVKGYEGIYSISDQGDVMIHALNRLMKQAIDKDGYPRVGLTNAEGVKKYHRVGRLVGIHFIPNPENKPEINHDKGIKVDSRATELSWTTKSENHKHAYRIGIHALCKHRDPATGRMRTV